MILNKYSKIFLYISTNTNQNQVWYFKDKIQPSTRMFSLKKALSELTKPFYMLIKILYKSEICFF